MGTQISFPGLGVELTLNRVALSLGPFTIYWYGLIVVAGMGLGLFYAMKRAHHFQLDPDKVLDITLYSIVAGLIGARLYYVAFSWEYYSQHPEEIIRIWEGGIAIYGGIIGGFAAGILLCRRWKIAAFDMADLAVGGLILGQAIGRWGNFMNVEAFGANTTLPWGMTGPTIVSYLEVHKASLGALGVMVDPMMPVHPTFFYESAWNFVGFGMLAWVLTRRRFQGELTLLYVLWYGLGRAWIEGLRTDSLMWGNIRVSQALAMVLAVVAAGLLVYLWKKPVNKPVEPIDKNETDMI